MLKELENKGMEEMCLVIPTPQIYRKTSSVSRTKPQSLNVYCILV